MGYDSREADDDFGSGSSNNAWYCGPCHHFHTPRCNKEIDQERADFLEDIARLKSERKSLMQAALGPKVCTIWLEHGPCGKPAACLGAYEGSSVYEYACDEHCGHGNEDGHCEPIGTGAP